MSKSWQIIVGDCLGVMRGLASGSVHCVVTSPAYFNLRDYGVEGQMGLEATPEEFVAALVEVHREIRRVLRDDGTVWLNLGPSYSSGVPNMADCMNRVLKRCFVFGLDTTPIACATERIDISLNDQGPPQSKLLSLFGMKGECVKDGDDDFAEVFNLLTIPRDRRSGCASTDMRGDCSAPDSVFQMVNSADIVIPYLDADLKSKLAVLRIAGTGPSHNNDATFPIKESSEPRIKRGVRWHTNLDSILATTQRKGIPDINFVDTSVPLRNGFLPFACLLCDFTVTQASQEKVTFTSIKGGFVFTVSDVGHLWFSMYDGSLIPYSTLYAEANKISNRECSKQEIDTPNMVKNAMQNDGWICRQTIIWHKPNPMPESCTDRCTKAHEFIFLLTKKPIYYYDHIAIQEPAAYAGQNRGGSTKRYEQNAAGMDNKQYNTRNKRSVWTVTPQPYPGAHFAVFPEKLIEPCILAGTSERGCCPECGAPWVRVVETARTHESGSGRSGNPISGKQDAVHGGGETGDIRNGPCISTKTIGWQPGCFCHGNWAGEIGGKPEWRWMRGLDHEPVPCTVLDPFSGAGTTGVVAVKHGRNYIGIELNPEYAKLSRKRIEQSVAPLTFRTKDVFDSPLFVGMDEK